MRIIDFHESFKLNGNSFQSKEELLAYAKDFSDALSTFLESWFDKREKLIVKTSGSTGTPKPIELKKEYMKNSALTTGEFFNLKENTSALLCMPLEYIAGKMMLVRAMILGWDLDIVNPVSNPLSGNKKKYDFSAMVPLQLQNSLQEIDRINTLIVGGGVVSETLKNQIKNIKTKVFATYGMTETITHIAVKKLNNQHRKPTFYCCLPNVEISIDNRSCLVINAPKVSDEVVVTNDVVQLVSENEFEWLGRFDNVINSGGVKLHPEIIERKLAKIINKRFFITGIPDAYLGEKMILLIEEEGDSTKEKSILEKIKLLASISKYEIPKQVIFAKHFVETETKKIQRKKTLDLVLK
ncbi:AMP-binding protein [Tenacibaculum sp. MEBiC06402]|uniref:AMP-binding protein n=1 Tax=unclassified Tenacibaculum TaxID=2635139 RepID=UPI003B9C6734